MLPTRAGEYKVIGNQLGDFQGRTFDLKVTEIRQYPKPDRIVYEFTPGFYGDFSREDFNVIQS
jgi:hypothetical protein